MVLDGLEEERDAVEHLDGAHVGDAHVEEDPEEDGVGDQLEDGRQQDREARQQRHQEVSQALV